MDLRPSRKDQIEEKREQTNSSPDGSTTEQIRQIELTTNWCLTSKCEF